MFGITKMKQLAGRYVYWKGIYQDIESMIKACEVCTELLKNPHKVPVLLWDHLYTNCKHLHTDYAEPFENQYFSLCIDTKNG